MTDLVSFVFSVGGLIAFVSIGVLWIRVRPQSKRARRFTVVVTLLYALGTIYAISFGLSRILVAGFHPVTAADVPPGSTAIAVLGSGSYTIRDWSDNEYSSADATAASRVLEAVRVHKLLNADWVISSGGNRSPEDPDQPSGEAMQHLMIELGVPKERVVSETTSRNTHEEAVLIAALVTKLEVVNLVVVTSEFHMRRSIGAFRAAGIRAIPAIVREPFPPRSWHYWVVPSDEGLWSTSMLAHEVLGIAYYAARGWLR